MGGTSVTSSPEASTIGIGRGRLGGQSDRVGGDRGEFGGSHGRLGGNRDRLRGNRDRLRLDLGRVAADDLGGRRVERDGSGGLGFGGECRLSRDVCRGLGFGQRVPPQSQASPRSPAQSPLRRSPGSREVMR